jgi:hypothetical protein
MYQAAQAPLLYSDDTPMRVLKPNKQGKQAETAGPSGAPGELKAVAEAVPEEAASATPKATGTSCIVAQAPKYEVVLYFTGPAHAGKNMEKVQALRAPGLPPPVYMCDALAANTAGDFITVLCHCLSHGRRRVVDVLEQFPEQGRHVLQVLGRVYFHDQHCREHQFDAAQRLEYHQTHSGPLMQALKAWMEQRIEQREVEPSSCLGTVSAAGFLTGYEYGVFSVTGLNGSTTTGTHRITRLTPTDFAARAPSTVPVDIARHVLVDMGMPELPYSVASPSARSMLLDAAPKMTPEQVAEFLQRTHKMGQ